MQCPHCKKQIPQDSVYCYLCGKEVSKAPEQTNSKGVKLKNNPRQNRWATLGIFVFFVALIGFDFIMGTIMGAIGNVKIPFYISLALYCFTLVCGIMSLYVDYRDEKRGIQPNGNKNYAYVCIGLSIFISLINLTQIILK